MNLTNMNNSNITDSTDIRDNLIQYDWQVIITFEHNSSLNNISDSKTNSDANKNTDAVILPPSITPSPTNLTHQ